MSEPVRLGIDIWSDVMCPWCVIAYHNLQKALAELEGEISADVTWHPFELNPDMPPEGEGMSEHMLRKYGRAPDARMTERMRQLAADAGYEMRYLGPKPVPERRLWNTRKAHVLLAYALHTRGPEAQTRLKLALFDSYFQHHRNIHDSEVLFEIAETCGIDREESAQALADPDLVAAVVDEQRRVIETGVTSVPLMVIAGRYMIPGSQEPEVYAARLRKVADKLGAGEERE
ncbi:DsbA family oxidoreductase [Novosphingobium aquimarinum]|uniref:DsbA family oxidoreductase n=1 Tax=Novosphingobium aquimarinum TaxID=2682494 RepID=UPI0012EC163B|nr:DsbA family oxidoreductase [Novosphingobium aquimarinum]